MHHFPNVSFEKLNFWAAKACVKFKLIQCFLWTSFSESVLYFPRYREVSTMQGRTTVIVVIISGVHCSQPRNIFNRVDPIVHLHNRRPNQVFLSHPGACRDQGVRI